MGSVGACPKMFWVVSCLTMGLLVLMSGCDGTTSSGPAGATPSVQATASPTPVLTPTGVAQVKVENAAGGMYGFNPAMLTVRVGTQVIWTNETGAPHTVSSDMGVFNIDLLAPSQTFSFVFTRPGTYPYFCNYHPYMKGVIVVTA